MVETIGLNFEQVHIEHLIKALKEQRVIIAVGSGLSQPEIPSWRNLLTDKMPNYLRKMGKSTEAELVKSTAEIGQYLNAANIWWDSLEGNRPKFVKFFEDTFDPPELKNKDFNIHKLICTLPLKIIFTTNYDRLFEMTDGNYTPKIHSDDLAMIFSSDRRFLVKLHGTYDDLDSIVLTSMQYGQLSVNKAYTMFLKAMQLQYTLVFIGYGGNDPDLDRIRNELLKETSGFANNIYMTLSNPSPEMIANLRNKNIVVLEYDGSKTQHKEISLLLQILSSEIHGRTKKITIETELETKVDWIALQKVFEESKLHLIDMRRIGISDPRKKEEFPIEDLYTNLSTTNRDLQIFSRILETERLVTSQEEGLEILLESCQDYIRSEEERGLDFFQIEPDSRTIKVIAQYLIEHANAKLTLQPLKIVQELISLGYDKLQTIASLKRIVEVSTMPVNLETLFAKYRQSFIVGDAGSGKSTLLRHISVLCFIALRERSSQVLEIKLGIKNKTLIPIYVQLENFGLEQNKSNYSIDSWQLLLIYICHYWRKLGLPSNVLDSKTLSARLEKGNIWLLLDGLDEIGDEVLRESAAAAIGSLCQKFPLSFVTATSRPAAVNVNIQQKVGLYRFRISELKPEQIDLLIDNFMNSVYSDKLEIASQKANKLRDALNNSPGAYKLATTPLLLTVIAVIHERQGYLPEYKAALYKDCIEQLFAQRSDEAGKLSFSHIKFDLGPVHLGFTEIISIVNELAYLVHNGEEDEYKLPTHSLLSKILKQKIDLNSIQDPHSLLEFIPEQYKLPMKLKSKNIKNSFLNSLSKRLLNFLDLRVGLLIYRSTHYQFAHRTLQEYSAASYLNSFDDETLKKELLNIFINPLWREVILLCFGILARDNRKIREYILKETFSTLVKIRHSSLSEILELSTNCLMEMEAFAPMLKLHHDLKNEIEKIRSQNYQNPQLFLSCGKSLSNMNEPSIEVYHPSIVNIPEMFFEMGSIAIDQDGGTNEKPLHKVFVNSFSIGKYPVTNKEYAEFIRHSGYSKKSYWIENKNEDIWKWLKKEGHSEPRYWYHEKFGNQNSHLPVVGISWYEAAAYCVWWTEIFGQNERVMTLPTEAQWELASKWPIPEASNARIYPWGNKYPDKSLTNFGDFLGKTTEVGSYPKGATPGGIFDLSGNVWEWCRDRYDENYYQWCCEQGVVKNPQGPQNGKSRVIRGGAWDELGTTLRTTNRSFKEPEDRSHRIGFRVVILDVNKVV